MLAGTVTPRSEVQPASSLRVISREGPRALAIVAVSNQEYVALDEVAALFGLTLREDRLAGGITATVSGRSIIITPDQPVVSVGGRLVSLTAPPIRQGNRWLIPVEALQRAIGPLLETRIEVRRASRLVVVGNVRVPRVTARAEHSPGSATVIVDITPATPQRVTMDPGRLTVSIDADALDLAVSSVAANEFLQAIQPGDTPTTIRIVTGPKFGLHRATTAQTDATSSRLTIDLLPSGTEAPALPPPVSPTSSPTPPPLDPMPILPATGIRTIVIDPGHGGDEAGARGAAGTLEKDITLAVARRLRTMIESRLGLRVFQTRDDDHAMALDDRSAYANSQRADLFVSLHANAALRPTLKGTEVYYLTGEAVDASEGSEGVPPILLPALGGGTRAVDLVRWESAQSRHLRESAALAGTLEQALRGRVEMSGRPVQQAPFRVLVGAAMPAVLVEMGYLSNAEQEKALASSSYQDLVVQALFDGIVRYRAQAERAPAAGQQR